MGLFGFLKRLFGGGKAKAEKADAAFGLSVKRSGETKKERRRAFRVPTPGLKAQVPEIGGVYPVKDLSVIGAGLVIERPHQKAGTLISLNLGQAGKVLVRELKAKIVRHEEGVVGCAFFDVSEDQENDLSKIVLAGQKLKGAQRGRQTQPAPGAKPAQKPGIPPAQKAGARPAAQPASKPGAQAAPRPGAKPGAQPAPKPGATPAARPPQKPAK